MKRKFITRIAIFLVALLIGYLSGLAHPAHLARDAVENVAYETTPGPYGSGVLADWSGLSHGLYCFQPGSGDTYYTKANRTSSPASSALMACQGEDVRVYGDSITFGGKSALAAELNALGYTVFIDAWSGRPTAPAVDALVAETVLPRDVIMATGTNDIFNPTVMGAQIQRAENFIAQYNIDHGTDVRLWWVNVQATRWSQADVIQRNDQRNSMAINLAIYQRIQNERVINIAGRYMDNPALLTNYLSDGTHYKVPTGYNYWGAFIRNWIQVFGDL